MNREHTIPSSELIINEDGSIFHLHMKPCELKSNIILVGDPNRVEMISSLLDSITTEGSNREFIWKSGSFKGKEITILSTGIGSDNIDIVMNELDALANIDFASRKVKKSIRSLNIVRLGSCGVVQEDIEAGTTLISRYTIGIDSLLNFYSVDSTLLEEELAIKFATHLSLKDNLSHPYAAKCSDTLFDKFKSLGKSGITVTAPGFYAPQGRYLRLEPSIDGLVGKISKFCYKESKILNLEMESAPINALSNIMGHHAITLCIGIAQRSHQQTAIDYSLLMKELAKSVLNKF